jgi:hypothetical protein
MLEKKEIESCIRSGHTFELFWAVMIWILRRVWSDAETRTHTQLGFDVAWLNGLPGRLETTSREGGMEWVQTTVLEGVSAVANTLPLPLNLKEFCCSDDDADEFCCVSFDYQATDEKSENLVSSFMYMCTDKELH